MDRSAAIMSAVAAVLYLSAVRFLRYRRRDRLLRQYGPHAPASLADMKLHEAFEMVRDLTELEFPTIFPGSVFFALFKTYGIPSISRLLVATGQLRNDTTASKRAADTGVIITEMVLNEPMSPRRIDAIARMNYLHGRYIRAGKISNDDMLYTLGLFVLEPIRWTAQYDWRPLTDVEKCALGLFWKDIGECMEISFDPLGHRKFGFDDGLAWLEALESWCSDYEIQNMMPAETNREIARATINIALFNVPKALSGFVSGFISALLGPRLQRAML